MASAGDAAPEIAIPIFDTIAEFEDHLIENYPDLVEEIRADYLTLSLTSPPPAPKPPKLPTGAKRLASIQKTMRRKDELEIQGDATKAKLKPAADYWPYADPAKSRYSIRYILF